MTFQQITIVGNVGRDPEMRFTPDGTPVTNFTIAVNYRRKDFTEEVTWFRVACWNKLAEVCNDYVEKGRQVLVVGRVSTSAWTDKDGQPRASLEVTADTVRFLGGRGDGEQERFPEKPELDGQEEIPF